MLASAPVPAAAHEIPARVTVLAFVRPEGRILRVIVRAPLEAMRDIDFPVRGAGYLELDAAERLLYLAAETWIAGSLEVEADGRPLPAPRIAAARVSLPYDRSFESYATALAHATGPPLPPGTELVWQQALLDVVLEYPIESDRADFTVRSGLDRLGQKTRTVLRFLPAGGGERAFDLSGHAGPVRLDPRWHQAALGFVRLGFRHILDGIDHLLFVLCLVIPVRRLRPLVVIVTAFTVAHSVTLVASTLGLAPSALWFPPLIETLIALSIVFLAFENILGAGSRRRWLVAFGFGLVHGFGFSFFLGDSLQFAGGHLAASLLAFNVGVELGQLLIVALAFPVLAWLFRRVPERVGVILLSALVAHSAWHWMTERASTLRQYRVDLPALDATLLPALLRLVLLLVLVLAAGWLVLGLATRLGRTGGRAEGQMSGQAAVPKAEVP
ncbi:MAG TPA: HupE/UreJ family protein [Gemmatimonadales bacterium]|nr:HupE/UreJ family protein [Gemmatimonadales bacterium]